MLTTDHYDSLAVQSGGRLESWMSQPPRPAMWHFTPDQRDAFARAIEAEVRKEDETLIRQLMLALDDCAEDSETVVNDYVQAYGESFRPHRLKGLRDIVAKAKEALDAARLRLLESDRSHLTQRGKEAWAGVDPQKLRETGAL